VFEPHSAPVVPRAVFLRRVARHGGYTMMLVLASLGIGVLGFHGLAGQTTIDALLNSAMLLGGMGPVGDIQNDAGKLFASAFALYAGLVFITAAALLLVPVLHRLLHRFHAKTRSPS
jgi:hypothetical protein